MIGFPRIRFSLRTLLLFVLLAGSVVSLCRRWEPWEEVCARPAHSAVGLHDDSLPVETTLFSPDGRFFTAATNDSDRNALQVVEVSSGRCVCELRGHKSRLLHASFSRDGTKIATSGEYATARMWNAATGKSLGIFGTERDGERNEERIYRAEFSPDGKQILTAGYDHSVILWDVSTATPARRFPDYSYCRDYDVPIFPDDSGMITQRAETWGGPQHSYLEEQKTGQLIGIINLEAPTLCSPDGRFVFSTGNYNDNRIIQYDLDRVFKDDSGTPWITPIRDKHMKVCALAVSPSGKRLAAIDESDGSIQILDTVTLELRTRIDNALRVGTQTYACVLAQFCPDESRLFTVADSGPLCMWDLEHKVCLHRYAFSGEDIDYLRIAPDGSHFIVVTQPDKEEWYKTMRKARLFHRRRPEQWWGVAWLPEFWLSMIFLCVLPFSVWRDRKHVA